VALLESEAKVRVVWSTRGHDGRAAQCGHAQHIAAVAGAARWCSVAAAVHAPPSPTTLEPPGLGSRSAAAGRQDGPGAGMVRALLIWQLIALVSTC